MSLHGHKNREKSTEGVFPNCMRMKTFSFSVTSAVIMLLLAAGCTSGYKPVILVHGVFSGPSSFKNLSRFIKKAHPGTEVTAIDLFNNEKSTKSMWKQIDDFAKVIQKIMEKSPEGVHLLCYSQGGLICRGVLSKLPNHNVHNFIVLSSPLAGQFGVPEMLHEFIPVSGRKLVYLICYRRVVQRHFSICNYWNDPHRRVKDLKFNNFLPLLNGEKAHGKMAGKWKKNFLRIKKLVLIGGPGDDVITPWQSRYPFQQASFLSQYFLHYLKALVPLVLCLYSMPQAYCLNVSFRYSPVWDPCIAFALNKTCFLFHL
uniref:palmitoyl-CoA hydrolase n=1 Tax=Oryzias melastigma TaxID=30732 RepID=A0A3B3DT26_ORYME